MKRRFSEEQIIGAPREQEAGGTVTGDHPAARGLGAKLLSLEGEGCWPGGAGAAPSEGVRGGERQAGEVSGGGAPGQRRPEGCRLAKVARPGAAISMPLGRTRPWVT